jgi:hypothetical protein
MSDTDRRRRHLRTAGVAAFAMLIGLAIGLLLAPSTAPTSPPTPAPTSSSTAQPSVGPTSTEQPDGDAARTEEGAVAAALGWMQRFTPALYLDDDARRAAVTDIAASSAEEELQTITADIAQSFRDAGVTEGALEGSVRLALPAGYEVVSFSGDAAEVAIWVAQVVHIDDVSPLAASWATQTTEMTWEDQQWRLVAVSSSDGPVPDLAVQGDGQLTQSLAAIRRFTEFSHEP